MRSFRPRSRCNNGYPLTTQPGADVLRVTASITELDVAATPGTAGTQRMFIVSPSDLTLTLELRDSQSGALLARAIDRRKAALSAISRSKAPWRIPPRRAARSRCGPACCAPRSIMPAAHPPVRP